MINIKTETILPMHDVPAHAPIRRGRRRPHISAPYRWAQRGINGVKLETLQTPGGKVTSVEALQRFFDRLTAISAERPFVPSDNQRLRDIEAAERELEGDAIKPEGATKLCP